MASGYDVVVKMGADIRDAIAGFRRIREEAERTSRDVESRLQRTTNRIRATQIGQGGAAFSRGLAAGQPFGQAALSGLAVAFPEAALLETSLLLAGSLADRLNHVAERLEAAQKQLREPESRGDVIAGFRESVAAETASIGGVQKIARTTFDLITQGGTGNEIERGRNRRANFRELVRSNPLDAAIVLAAEGNDPELQKIYAEETRHAAATTAYRKSQAATVVNIHTPVAPSTGGQDIEAMIRRAERNNGYQTSRTRTG